MCSRPRKNVNYEVSRGSRAVTAKKCTKKRDARVVVLNNLLLFSRLSLPSPSSLLKLSVKDFKIRRRDGNEKVA